MMHLCFVVESRYRCDSMPLKVAERLAEWDHEVTIIEPAGDPLNIGTFLTQPFDAVVLKTVADGPGLNVLELATARGLITINRLRAIRRARDKAAAIGLAMRFGLPVPQTWFAPTIDQFARLPQSLFPMIIKPANGSSNECIHLAVSNKDISDLADLYRHDEPRFWLAQRAHLTLGGQPDGPGPAHPGPSGAGSVGHACRARLRPRHLRYRSRPGTGRLDHRRCQRLSELPARTERGWPRGGNGSSPRG
jgi:hypothetical protein